MKQRKSKQVRLFSGMLIGIVMIAVLARIVYLNHCYPSPKVITYTDNDTIKLGNYEIKQTGWEWGDGSLLKEKCPDYVYHQMDDGSEYPFDSVRVGLITLSVTKVKDDTTSLDLTSLAFEMGTNGDQYDMELFFKLNPTLEALEIKLSAGEVVSFVIPYIMDEQQVSKKDWSRVDKMKLYMVLQYYPQKIIILFVMLVFVNVQVIGPLRQCKMLMGEMLSIPEAFVALGNSGVILLIIPILFLVLMADFPQRTGIDRFYQMRCTKRTWIFGQAVFAAAASCFVLLFLLVSSCVLMIGTGRWSLSFSDAVTHFTSVYPDRTGDYVVQLLPGNLYQQMTLEQALIHTFCLLLLYFLLISYVLLFSTVSNHRYVGILANGFAIILGAVTCEVRMKQMWILPMAHTIPWLHYDEYLDRMNFPMWGSYLYLAAISALLLVLCFARAGHYQVKE